ncbi:MAG: hypothetical protein ABI197_02510 [Granulicella sp.]
MSWNFAHFDPVEFFILSAVFVAVIIGWIIYTRRLKTPPNVSKTAGIAIATEKWEHPDKH